MSRSPYLDKCKRLRMDGPTPCLCCPRECVGDDPSVQMLPEVEEMLRRRERPTFTLQITGRFDVCGYQTRTLNLTPALGLALLVGIVYLVGVNSF